MTCRKNSSIKRGFLTCCIFSGLALGFAGPGNADTVHLHSGRKIEGQVLEQSDTVTIRVGKSTLSIAKDQIAKIEFGPTPAEQLLKKEAALPFGDATARYLLSEWCARKGLKADQKRLLWQTIETDPDHERSREKLGFTRLGAIWLTEGDYQRAQGKLLFEGRWLRPEKHEAAVRKARSHELLSKAKKLLRLAASREPEVERQSALSEFRKLPSSLRAWTLLKSLKSLKSRHRQFAVRELGVLNNAHYEGKLAHVAVTDRKRSVRDEALGVLKKWEQPDTVLRLLPYLSSGQERHRINAARAINVFPDRRAVGELIRTAHFIWADFGRSHFSNLTQRAYIKDYVLVSGGTGLVVQEVADPVIDTFVEGVVLDIDIRKAEAFARVATLQTVTGQKFGTDFGKWQSWWKQQTGTEAGFEELPKNSDKSPQKKSGSETSNSVKK